MGGPDFLRRLLTVVERRLGLLCSPQQYGEVLSIAEETARALGGAGQAAVLRHLATSEEALERLAGALTVGETYFFREPQHFRFVTEHVAPAHQAARPAAPFRAWSAGCASGEEAYSLAMVLLRAGLADPQVLGTDISPQALARARAGVYTGWSFRGDSAAEARRSMDPVAGPRTHPDLTDRRTVLSVPKAIRRHVTFEPLNLLTMPEPPDRRFHLIFCRNVLIYLTEAARRRVMDGLLAALEDDGWLVTASSDPSLVGLPGAETVATSYGVFYRKTKAALAAPAPGIELPIAPEPPPHRAKPARAAPREHASRGPDHDQLAQARAAYLAGDYVGCLRLTERGGHALETCLLRMRAAANLADREVSQRVFSAETSRHPLCPEVHVLAAAALQAQGQNGRALESFRRALYLDPTCAAAQLGQAVLLEGQQERAAALHAYIQALRLVLRHPEEQIVPFADAPAGALTRALRQKIATLNESGAKEARR